MKTEKPTRLPGACFSLFKSSLHEYDFYKQNWMMSFDFPILNSLHFEHDLLFCVNDGVFDAT